MGAHVSSVNAGPAVDVPWGSLKRSAIDKRPVEGPVEVVTLGLRGDEIADLKHHGGVDQAVYAYAREDLDAWEHEVGRTIRDGEFGENLTTVGLDVQNARIGDRWRIGTTLLEIADVRIPCSVFAGFVDQPRWVRRFTERGVPGAYLRVVEEGTLRAGDEVEVVESRDHDLTVGLAFRAQTTERHEIGRFAVEPRASAKIRSRVDARSNDTVR